MANLGQTFDPNEVEPTSRPDPVPEGRYVLQVIDSDIKPTKSGQMLALTMEIHDGPYQGRKVFENLNIQNASAQAQEIAQRQLSALCRAAGITQAITDSQDLHYQPFEADLKIEPARTVGEKTYDPRNAIKKYVFEDQAPPAGKPAPSAPPPPQRQAAGGSRPWERRAS